MTEANGYNNPAYTHQFDSSVYDYEYVPEIDPERGDRQEKIYLVRRDFQDALPDDSEEFEASDESNQSVIVEECNNRRVTLICDKRNKMEGKFYEDSKFNGAYHQNISLDSEEDYRQNRENKLSQRQEYDGKINDGRNRNPVQCQTYQRQHRYEEIDDYDDTGNKSRGITRHRYAEISVENGYPSIGNEIEIEHNGNGYRIVNNDNRRDFRAAQKPRAPSPQTISPKKTYQRKISPHRRYVENIPPRVPVRSMQPLAIEMAELSPTNIENRSKSNFFKSPKRHPPIGASSPAELQEQRKAMIINHGRRNSFCSDRRKLTPSKPSVTQMFQVTPPRRNISYSFPDSPKCYSGAYGAAEPGKAKTAIITPILQRKNGRNETGSEDDDDDDERNNFKKISHLFQSTGDLYKKGIEYRFPQMPERIKRNQSVPNFAQSLSNEGKYKCEIPENHRVPKSARKLDYQYSPAKSDRFSPINRSKISLIDQTILSGTDFNPPASGCLIVGAIIQILTSIASSAICFYLFSKVGRRYYLDFGILAGFVNFVLGALGFRSQCWKWLPNRNYVSGYILLTAFSISTCGGFVYLITARPMSGDPILDLIGGGICGISVLTIILSVTGLTMSGCCKSPPPDNRVNNI